MKRLILLWLLLAGISCTATGADTSGSEASPGNGDISVEWDRSTIKLIASGGGYGRIHRLLDGRLMGVYEKGGCGHVIFSSDDGTSWSSPKMVFPSFVYGTATVNIANCEFAQLSREHPLHPGRIIFAANLRPAGNASSVHPYAIACIFSDDGGKTWSSMTVAYSSKLWDTDIAKGCWEPFVLELPDGTVQIYFADETPYWSQRLKYQNISVTESSDGGASWSTPRIVCYADKTRDGMPVALLLEGTIYVVVEHYDAGTRFYPQVVSSPAENSWQEPVLNGSPFRFDIFPASIASATIYRGAPYLIRTDDYLAVSWQVIGTEYDRGDEAHAMMEVAVCPISEMHEGKFTTMRAISKPLLLDEATNRAKWNSLCDLGGNSILAVSSTKAGLVTVRGKIVP